MTEFVSARPAPVTASRFHRSLAYLVTGLPLGIAAFVLAVTGFATGVGTLVVWLGLPILVLTLRACRGLAGVERRVTEWATGRPLPPHHYRRPDGRGVGRLLSAVADPQSWRDLLHAVVAFPVRIATFAIAVSWTVGGLGGLLYPVWEWSLPGGTTTGCSGCSRAALPASATSRSPPRPARSWC